MRVADAAWVTNAQRLPSVYGVCGRIIPLQSGDRTTSLEETSMGYQRGRQAQQQLRKSDRQTGQPAPVVTRSQATEEAMQELLGSRAASRQLRSEMQQGTSSQPMQQMVQAISPVSPRVQAKSMFRGG